MYFSKNINCLKNDSKVILANIVNGFWIKFSEEVYEILTKFVDLNLTLSDIQNSFEDEEDYSFFSNFLINLKGMNIVIDNNIEELNLNRMISYELTSKCNLKCIHCCMDAGNESLVQELSTTDVKSLLKKMADWNPGSIMLSGGEPMLRKDFTELLLYLRQIYSGNIILSTNATLIKQESIDILVENIDLFEISLDGIDENTCAPIRGKAVFEKVVNNIKLLKKAGTKNINLSIVIGDKNEELKVAFEKLSNELGTKPIFRIFSAVGRGEKNKEVYSDIDDKHVYIPTDFLQEDYYKSPHICCCSAGQREVFIRSNGDVYPCVSYMENEHKMGNLLKTKKLDDLTVSYSAIENVYIAVEKLGDSLLDCRNCCVNIFCWTCPGLYYEIKTIDALRHNCQTLKPLLLERVWEKEYDLFNLDYNKL